MRTRRRRMLTTNTIMDLINVKVNKATKDLDLFMRKDPPVLTMDEMRTSSTLIDKYAC